MTILLNELYLCLRLCGLRLESKQSIFFLSFLLPADNINAKLLDNACLFINRLTFRYQLSLFTLPVWNDLHYLASSTTHWILTFLRCFFSPHLYISRCNSTEAYIQSFEAWRSKKYSKCLVQFYIFARQGMCCMPLNRLDIPAFVSKQIPFWI